MKVIFFFILCAVVGYIFFRFTPTVSEMVTCYEVTRKQYDSIGYNTGARSWDPKQVCLTKYDAIASLDECLSEVKTNRNISTNIYNHLFRIVGIIRPFDVALKDRKITQNEECSDFPNTVFDEGGELIE